MLYNQKPLYIAQGSHNPEDGEACLMEWVSIFNGDGLTDYPSCTDRWFAKFAQLVNDEIENDDVRASLAPLISRISKVREPLHRPDGRTTQDTEMRVTLSLFEYLLSGPASPKTSAVNSQDSYVVFGIRTDLKEAASRAAHENRVWSHRLLGALVSLACEDGKPKPSRSAYSALLDVVAATADDEELVGLLHHGLHEWERIVGVPTGHALTETQLNTLNAQMKDLKEQS